MILAVCGSAGAQVSSLAGAPSAGLRRSGELQLELNFKGQASGLNTRFPTSSKATFGLREDLEIGWESDFDGTTRFGFKHAFWQGLEGRLQAVAGWEAIGYEDTIFAAARFRLPLVDLHAGFLSEKKGQAFLGASASLPIGLRLSGDHITGPSGKTTFRANKPIGGGFALDARLTLPNDLAKPETLRGGVFWTGRF
ncbi:MAG: hypothetical protein MH204_04260 [Fimbriimonadaceae bacterium]|nr:hypothetical protein [Fimbriimonadaceae bacterium]